MNIEIIMNDIKSIKVLHVAETLPGGPATHLRELLPQQVTSYENVSVFCRQEHVSEVTTVGVKVFGAKGVKRNVRGLINFALELRRHLHSHEYDIIHLHSSFAGLIGRIITQKRQAKVVYCSRGWSFTMNKPNYQKFIYGIIEKFLSKKTDWIINISNDEQRAAIKFGLPLHKMSIVYNGISDKGWTPISSGTVKNIVYVGRYDEQKGIDVLLKAMETLHMDGISLTTIGGHAVGKPQVSEFPSYIRNLGWKASEEVVRELASADAVVMPSRWEGFGFVAAEAMCAGRPIVATDVGGLSELVIDNETGVKIQPNSVSEIVDGVKRLKHLDIQKMGNAARNRFVENFTSDRMFNGIDSVYRNILRN